MVEDSFLEVKNSGSSVTGLNFREQKLIGSFQITETQEFSNDAVIPKMISEDSMKKLNGSDTYLGEGFDTAIKIEDPFAFRQLKDNYFLKWIVQEKYHKSVLEEKFKKPSFICFGGRISDTLITRAISRHGDWEIYAVKFNDAIYLWRKDDYEPPRDHSRNTMAFYGLYFEHLLTKNIPKESVVNECDQSYVIYEVTFGSHQILCINEIDAESENGDWVEFKVYKSCSPKGLEGKFLKYWGQNIVPGIQKLVIGNHENGRLKKVEITSTDALTKRIRTLNTDDCYDFQDRLLKFISSHLQENNPKVVKSFSWICGHARVKTSNVALKDVPESMLPKWYIEAVEAECQKVSSDYSEAEKILLVVAVEYKK